MFLNIELKKKGGYILENQVNMNGGSIFTSPTNTDIGPITSEHINIQDNIENPIQEEHINNVVSSEESIIGNNGLQLDNKEIVINNKEIAVNNEKAIAANNDNGIIVNNEKAIVANNDNGITVNNEKIVSNEKIPVDIKVDIKDVPDKPIMNMKKQTGGNIIRKNISNSNFNNDMKYNKPRRIVVSNTDNIKVVKIKHEDLYGTGINRMMK